MFLLGSFRVSVGEGCEVKWVNPEGRNARLSCVCVIVCVTVFGLAQNSCSWNRCVLDGVCVCVLPAQTANFS